MTRKIENVSRQTPIHAQYHSKLALFIYYLKIRPNIGVVKIIVGHRVGHILFSPIAPTFSYYMVSKESGRIVHERSAITIPSGKRLNSCCPTTACSFQLLVNKNFPVIKVIYNENL